MERVAFKMRLFPGREAEYKKRHDEIWPELAELLAAFGIRDYSIFHDPETNILFAVHRKTATRAVRPADHAEMVRAHVRHHGHEPR